MLRWKWKPKQREVFVTLLPELANLAMAALGFGEALSDRPFSWALVIAGIALWAGLVAVTVAVAGVDES